MKYRIAKWGIAGFLVAWCWMLCAWATGPLPIISTPIVWALVRLTQPIVLAGFYFHFGVHLYWVLLSNVAVYALVGLIVESLRQQLHHAK